MGLYTSRMGLYTSRLGLVTIFLALSVLVTQSRSFTIQTFERPTVFTNTSVSWNRNSSDPTGFWLNVWRTDVPNDPNKRLMSFQVDDNTKASGNESMVFIQQGVHVIVSTVTGKDGKDNNFFTSPPITAIAATTGTPNCGPIIGSNSASSTPPPNPNSKSKIGPAAVAGGTVGGFLAGAIASAIVFFLVHRRSRKNLTSGHRREKSNLIDGSNESLDTSPPPVVTPFPHDASGQRQGTSQILEKSGTPIHSPSVAEPQQALTQRQQILADEADRLRVQILGMVNQALSTSRNEPEENQEEVEQLRTQIQELEAQRDSEWARGLTDEPPSYLASTGLPNHVK